MLILLVSLYLVLTLLSSLLDVIMVLFGAFISLRSVPDLPGILFANNTNVLDGGDKIAHISPSSLDVLNI